MRPRVPSWPCARETSFVPSEAENEPCCHRLLSSLSFQQLLGAAVQRLAAAKSLEDLLLRQDALVAELRSQLGALESEIGIRVDQVEIAKAVLEREELALAARLDRIRREAEASRDAIAAIASAEEKKSQGLRDHELARLAAEKVGDALKELPLKEARWITVGPDSPAGSIATLITALREVTTGSRKVA